MKTSPVNGVFPGSCHVGQTVTMLWGEGFERLQTLLPPPVAVGHLDFIATVLSRLLVLTSIGELGSGRLE